MNHDGVKLTTYFGERDRVGRRFLADAFAEIYARHGLHTSLVMRGAEGFGPSQHVRTDRLLTLSEDLSLVSVAVDARPRVDAALRDVARLAFDGLVTLERAVLVTAPLAEVPEIPWAADADTKLTIYLGRQERIERVRAYESVVALLHDRGVAGATVLLGVDGTVEGERHRARFFGRNVDVPLMVIAVGDSERIAAALPELSARLGQPTITLERLRVCKRDGVNLALPRELPDVDPSGLRMWQKLMVYSGEQAQVGGRPLHDTLVRELRRGGAAGATSLRGIWGYHGDHRPHGDSFWQLRRRVPVVTVIIDTPSRIRESFAIVDRLTRTAGLVTSEMVPAYRASARGRHEGGLRLAARLPIRRP